MVPDVTLQLRRARGAQFRAVRQRRTYRTSGGRSTTGISARLPIGLPDRSPGSVRSKTNSFWSRSHEERPDSSTLAASSPALSMGSLTLALVGLSAALGPAGVTAVLHPLGN